MVSIGIMFLLEPDKSEDGQESALRSFAYISEALARAAGNPLPSSD